MDFAAIEAEWLELQRRFKEWNSPIVAVEQETWHKRHHRNGYIAPYTEEDQKQEIEAIWRQQLAIYNPSLAARPAIERLISKYVMATSEERETIRCITGKLWYPTNALFSYIHKCAECLESPEDGEILSLALIAASIENYAHDFRDTDAVLAELAVAAREAGIDIEPYSKMAAELSSAERPKGGWMNMKAKLLQFHIYALTAERLI